MASTFRKKKAPTNASSAAPNTSPSPAPSSSSSSLLGLNGTKPWTGGITLTSTGLREFDALLLCGGQPLGTCIFLAEDRWTSLASTLVKYWCSEALSQGQHLLIPVPEFGAEDNLEQGTTPASPWNEEDEEEREDCSAAGSSSCGILDLLNSLPKNLHKERDEERERAERNANSKAGAAEAPPVLGTLAEEGEEDDGEDISGHRADSEDGLTIAWQYRKSVQKERLGGVEASKKGGSKSSSSRGANVFCHSYDLGSICRMEPRPCDVAMIVPISCCCCRTGTCAGKRSCGCAYHRQLVEQLDSLLQSGSSDRQVVRLLLYHPDASLLAIALPLLLSHIRHNELPVVIMVSVQPWTSTTVTKKKSLMLLRRCCDVVLEVQGFAGRSAETYPPPPEFRSLHGLLQTRKLNTGTAATAHGPGGGHFADATSTKRPAATMYGLKRDRRKLSIQLLHIPPEDYAQGGGSVQGGGVRSGAGRSAGGSNKGRETAGCGGGASSTLDF